PYETLLDLKLIDADPATNLGTGRDQDSPELDELVQGLKSGELLQPVVVFRSGERYRLKCGFRRLAAARKAGWQQIPARVTVAPADDIELLIHQLQENVLRLD